MDKLGEFGSEHYTEVEELLDSFAAERGLTTIEQLQVFVNELTEQRKQHYSLEGLITSISTHLTTEELSQIKENTVERREIHGTVAAIMEKYE
jgi:hypothetical protein